MPSTEQKRKIRNQFEILSIPCFVVKKDYSRGAKRGPTQEQYDHFRANESTRHARKKQYSFYFEQVAQRRIIQKFSNRHRMDQRTLSTFGFAHGNWFLIDSNAERASAIWKTMILLASMVKDRSQDQRSKQSSGHAKTSEESKSVFPSKPTIPTATWRRWGWLPCASGWIDPSFFLIIFGKTTIEALNCQINSLLGTQLTSQFSSGSSLVASLVWCVVCGVVWCGVVVVVVVVWCGCGVFAVCLVWCVLGVVVCAAWRVSVCVVWHDEKKKKKTCVDSKTPPCVHAKRLRVSKHVDVLPAHTETCCMYTWRRFGVYTRGRESRGRERRTRKKKEKQSSHVHQRWSFLKGWHVSIARSLHQGLSWRCPSQACFTVSAVLTCVFSLATALKITVYIYI